MATTVELINWAISNNAVLHIRYQAAKNDITERNISPIEWETTTKFRAYCHLRHDERHFHSYNILECRVEESLNPLVPNPLNVRTREEKLRRWQELDQKSAYNITPEEVEEYRQLKHEIYDRSEKTAPSTPTQTGGTLDIPIAISTRIPQSSATNSVITSTPSISAASPPHISTQFSQVETADQWRRLVSYYADCVVRESRQQYIIESTSRSAHFLPVTTDQIHQFMDGTINLEFDAGSVQQPTPMAKFIRAGKTRSDQQLCLGLPLLVLDYDKVAPLTLTTVKVEPHDSRIKLIAEDFEISYAALDYLRLSEEEISVILKECSELRPTATQSAAGAVEEFLIGRLSEILGQTLAVIPQTGNIPSLVPHTLCYTPCLFWVRPGIATANLITELKELAALSKWETVSQPLRQLLSAAPSHDYPAIVPYPLDTEIYVTAANARQRQAVAAARVEPISVITGPPGTGKSQLILNLITQTALRGQTVLFASRNNKAVDVVMTRLLGELTFKGAVRTGNRENRRSAASWMESALDAANITTAHLALSALRQNIAKVKDKLIIDEELLRRVRDMQGLAQSYTAERDDLLKILPKKVAELAEAHTPVYTKDEIEHLQSVIAALRLNAFALRDQQEQLASELRRLLTENFIESPILTAFKRFEDQWGPFGNHFLASDLSTFENIQSHLELWLVLLPTLEHQAEATRLTTTIRNLNAQLEQNLASLTPQQITDADAVATHVNLEQLESLAVRARQINEQAAALVQRPPGIWARLLAWIGLKNPARELAKQLTSMQETTGLYRSLPPSAGLSDLSNMAAICQDAASILHFAVLQLRLIRTQQTLAGERETLVGALKALPEAIQQDIPKVGIEPGASASLNQVLESFKRRVAELVAQRSQLTNRTNAKIDSNIDGLAILTTFKATRAGDNQKFWALKELADLPAIIGHLTKWHNILALWTTTTGLARLSGELQRLPTEQELIAKISILNAELYKTAADIIHANWVERVRALDTQTHQKARHYISAVKQLSEMSERQSYDPTQYGTLKSALDSNLPSALQIFPVWATTNLAAKSNLPLVPGLFDMVILDEASQSDFPSALPLLYRAKRIVIVGDPHQLRHVATLDSNSNKGAAAKFSIALEAFSYNDLSLFDIAQHSVGNHPGPLFLKEHYRSDPRIIGFSNDEFYARELDIRTDMSRLGMPEKYLKTFSGIFWLNIKGLVEYPTGGSLCNSAELTAIRELLPQLIEALEQNQMMEASIGIVTPYRQQEKLLRSWLMDHRHKGRALADTVLAGTAHKFQGDEKDIMIFSPVLSQGMSEGSLNWLNQTENLLNVAITRARATLIIVGDWEFCRNLPTPSKFRHLADYVGAVEGRVVQALEELPIFSRRASEEFKIVGTLLDRHDRDYNRMTLRKLLVSCKDFVWWLDPFMTDHVFDLLLNVSQQPDITLHDIRILTISEQVQPIDGNPPRLTTAKAQTVQNELKHKGVDLQVGILAKKDLPHDRYLYSGNYSINMPPFSGAFGDHKMVSEYTESKTTPDFFEQLWSQATRI